MEIGHVIILSGVLLSLALFARGFPPLRRTPAPQFLFVSAVLVLAGFFFWLGRVQGRLASPTSTWQESSAIVVRSERDSSDTAPTGGYVIEYVFEAGGKNYSGRTLVSTAASIGHERTRRLSMRFPVGRQIKIRFDSDNPSRNAIRAEGSAGSVRAYAIGGFLTAFAIGVSVWRIFRRAKPRVGATVFDPHRD